MTALSQPLDDILGTRAKVRTCRLLMSTLEPLSAREIGRLTGTAKRSVDLALRDLVQLGVVARLGSGAFAPYVADRENALVKDVLVPLFDRERRASQRLREALRKILEKAAMPFLWAGIFGSMARGDDGPASDLDLVVIVDGEEDRSRIQDRLTEHAERFAKTFGRTLSPMVLSQERFGRMLHDGDPLAKAIVADGRRITGRLMDIERINDGR